METTCWLEESERVVCERVTVSAFRSKLDAAMVNVSGAVKVIDGAEEMTVVLLEGSRDTAKICVSVRKDVFGYIDVSNKRRDWDGDMYMCTFEQASRRMFEVAPMYMDWLIVFVRDDVSRSLYATKLYVTKLGMMSVRERLTHGSR